VQIARTDNFKKAWKELSEEQKALTRKAIENLLTDIRYPALRVKKIKGTKDIWEARVNISIRMTFQIENEFIILRNIGKHDEALDNP
jgi:mRNA-degrading endonuclease RelE of RelBE toxin-antitoxin system